MCSKIRDKQDAKNDFYRAGKMRKKAWKPLAVGPKMKKILKNFQEHFENFLIKISREN